MHHRRAARPRRARRARPPPPRRPPAARAARAARRRSGRGQERGDRLRVCQTPRLNHAARRHLPGDRRLAARRTGPTSSSTCACRRTATSTPRRCSCRSTRSPTRTTTGTGGSSSPTSSATPPPRPPTHGTLKLLDEPGHRRRARAARGAHGPRRDHADVGAPGVRAARSSAACGRSTWPRVVALFDDLLLGSNVLGMLRRGRPRGAGSPARAEQAQPDGADRPDRRPRQRGLRRRRGRRGAAGARRAGGDAHARRLLARRRRHQAPRRRRRLRPRRPALADGARRCRRSWSGWSRRLYVRRASYFATGTTDVVQRRRRIHDGRRSHRRPVIQPKPAP